MLVHVLDKDWQNEVQIILRLQNEFHGTENEDGSDSFELLGSMCVRLQWLKTGIHRHPTQIFSSRRRGRVEAAVLHSAWWLR